MAEKNQWDSEGWKERFSKASQKHDHYMLHELRKEVFMDTIDRSLNGGYELEGEHIHIGTPDKSMVFESRLHVDLFPGSKKKTKVHVHVLNEDCLLTAMRLRESYPIVLNMANRQVPGGGVEQGAGAQEECLFRSSNYFQTLYDVKDRYPLDRNWGSVLSENVTVFRGLEDDGYPLLKEPFRCSFVAVPALYRPHLNDEGRLDEELENATRNKIDMIYDTAHYCGADSRPLILSAFGCGAFRNPPEHIAQIFREELCKYDHTFKEIIFAIKPDHNDPENRNFNAFRKVFENWNTAVIKVKDKGTKKPGFIVHHKAKECIEEKTSETEEVFYDDGKIHMEIDPVKDQHLFLDNFGLIASQKGYSFIYPHLIDGDWDVVSEMIESALIKKLERMGVKRDLLEEKHRICSISLYSTPYGGVWFGIFEINGIPVEVATMR